MISLANIYILIFNSLLWGGTYLYLLRKKGFWNLGVTFVLLYTIITIVALDIYLSPYAKYYFKENLTLFPLVYLYVMIMMAISPLLGIDNRKIKYYLMPNRKLLTLSCSIISIFTLLSLIKILPELKTGIIGLLIDSEYAKQQYAISTHARMHSGNSNTINFLFILCNISRTIVPFFFFSYLTLNNKSKLLVCLLTAGVLINPLSGIAQSSRLGIVSSFVIFGYLYVLFYNILSHKVKKTFKKGVIAFSFFIGFFFVIISIGRFNNGGSGYLCFNLERYLAEGPIVFDNYCMDAGGTRNGDYTFAIIQSLDRSNKMNELELRDKYSNLKIDNSRFYTFVGDFTLDFGPILAFIIFFIFWLITIRYLQIHQQTITYSQLIMCFILIITCSSFYQYQFSATLGNLVLLTLVLLAIFYNVALKCNYKLFVRLLNQQYKDYVS